MAESKRKNTNVYLLAGGDILIRQYLYEAYIKNGKEAIFADLKQIINNCDISFANLETPLLKEGEINKQKDKTLPFLKADPCIVEAINDAGFKILSIANNHIMDYGEDGLKQTINVLLKNNIGFIGAGMNREEATRSKIFELKGLKVGFLAYSNNSPANKNKAGCAPLQFKIIIENVNRLRAKCDFVIISLHHGIEYSDYPVPEHMVLAHKLIDNGVDVVLGHHPHVLQGMERYKDGVIVYSMGNLIFDQSQEEDNYRLSNSYLVQRGIAPFKANDRRVRESMLFLFELSLDKMIDVKLIPIHQNNLDTPKLAEEPENTLILQRYQAISEELHNPDLPKWKILSRIYACENVEGLKSISILTLLKKIYRIRLRHIKYIINYIIYKLNRNRR